MNYKIAVVLCLYITSIYSAPMKVQLLPIPYGMQPQNSFVPLQNPFFRQAVPNLQSPFMYPQQPMMLVLPNVAQASVTDERYVNLNEEESINSLKTNTGHVDDSKEAVILEANPNSVETDSKKTVVLMPGTGKNSIGQIISYIPFLPIEINVPDAINWIISHIPTNLFNRPVAPQTSTRFSSKGTMPILMIPAPMMPQV